METSQNFGARPACGSFDLGVRRRPKTASGVASVENQRLAVLEIDSPHYFYDMVVASTIDFSESGQRVFFFKNDIRLISVPMLG